MRRGNYHWEGHLPSAATPSSPRAKIALRLAGAAVFAAGLDFVAPSRLRPPPQSGDGGDGGGDGGGSATDGDGGDRQFRTYWTDTCREPDVRRPPLIPSGVDAGRSRRCRVVVIGGGMAGLHTALAIAEAEDAGDCASAAAGGPDRPDVMILEASRVGSSTGASGLSEGLVVPGIQVPQEDLAERVGKDVAAKVYDLTYEAEGRLRDIIERYGIQCRLEEGGGLVEASIHDANCDEEDGDERDDDDDDDGCRDLTAAEVQSMLGTNPSLYKCGEYDPSLAGVDPLGLTRGLARACEERGVRIHENTRAAGIETIDRDAGAEDTGSGGEGGSDGPLYRVTTETGVSVECDHVVLCSGAERVSPALSRRLSRSIIPLFTWMASTVPLGDKLPAKPMSSPTQAASPDGEGAGRSSRPRSPYPMGGDDFVSLNYWRFTPDGRLLFGSLADTYPLPAWLAERRLRRALGTVYPQLRDVKFERVWGGPLAVSRRAVPLIGRDADYDTCQNGKKKGGGNDGDGTGATVRPSTQRGGVWYATGFAGHGIVPTAMAGKVLADAIAGRDGRDTWKLFQKHLPPENTYYPVGRMGAQFVLMSLGLLDWLRVRGVPVPEVPKPW